MNRFYIFLLLCISINTALTGQQISQSIYGKITDSETEEALAYVNIVVKNSNPLIGTTSDDEGNYIIKNIPVGRLDIEASLLGYESIIITDVILNSSRPLKLDIQLEPTLFQLDEIVLHPKLQKQKPINKLAVVSARMLSVEESSRYAGGFDDPARLATSFAGVSSSNGSNNAIVIRGNAPKYLQWNIEGIEVPNPNHFANLVSFGGGGLTALSSNLLTNSDFFTGAFPASYNNAISGVFDLKMRNGSTQKQELGFETGLIGIDLTDEGPLEKNKDASYLFNYRYSTLGLLSFVLPEEARGINYQDLSYKLHFPTEKHGTFSLWGIGLLDKSEYEPKDEIDRVYPQDYYQQGVYQFMGSLGLNHRYRFKNGQTLQSSLAFTSDGIDYKTDIMNSDNSLEPKDQLYVNNYNIYLKSNLKSKLSDKISNLSGISLRGMRYNMDIKEYDNDNWQYITDDEGLSGLISGFSQFSLKLNKTKIHAGANAQYFELNGDYTIEPRFGFSYEINKNKAFNFGYGLHSRMEALHYYFSRPYVNETETSNKDLGFTKAHHWVIGYDVDINEKIHLKIEPYYQLLYDVPIVEGTNESLINEQAEWFVNKKYVNKGKGKNYGLDITLEKYMDKGYYYLFSGSVFQSLYKTEASEWFNTRYNKNFVINALFGKEFYIGKSKQNTLSMNIRCTLQGGERYAPVDQESSIEMQEVIYDYSKAFSEQTDPVFVLHSTFDYKWNKPKTTHKVSLKILNATQYKEFQGHRFNLAANKVEINREALMIPNISYKILF